MEPWTAVDAYISDLLIAHDPALSAALEASAAAGLPAISVSPPQGKLLKLLAQAQHARRILELGTLGAYSTIWLARALPQDGRLITLEVNPHHAEIARANLARAGVADRVEVWLGDARDSLRKLATEGVPPFDFVFIDADKPGYPEYLGLVLALVHPGSLIVADNVVREGAVADAASQDESVQGVRRFNALLAAEPRVSATIVQTVGAKGYDGFAVALVQP
jgi:predicted O-methyltransferase YrrM